MMFGRRLLVPLAVVIGTGTLAGCFPPGPPPPPPQVTYQLTGTCAAPQFDPNPGGPCVGSDALATFFNGNGDIEQHDVRFQYTVTISRPADGFVSISGQLHGDGAITCQITSGGRVVASTTSTGEFVIADCSASV
jgi:hypothetical protein